MSSPQSWFEPSFILRMRSSRREVNWSAIRSCTNSRSIEMQSWPELENSARLNWYVWMGKVGTSRSVVLPDPTAFGNDLTDPFQDAPGDDGVSHGPSARLLGLQFSDSSKTAAGLETFGSLTLDNIGSTLQAFTAVQVPVQ